MQGIDGSERTVQAEILIIAGYGYVLGLATVSLGLYLRFPSGLYRCLALLFILVALAALVVLIIGDRFHSLSYFHTISKCFSLPLNSLALVLGIALYQGHSTLTQEKSSWTGAAGELNEGLRAA